MPRTPDPFHQILRELGELHDRKAADYGAQFEDIPNNLEASHIFGVEPWIGCMIRLNDKVSRIAHFARGSKLNFESAEDSLKDIAVYAILALLYLQDTTT